MISPMLRSIRGLLLTTVLVVGLLVVVGRRPNATDVEASFGAPPPTDVPAATSTTTSASTTTTTTTTATTTSTTTTAPDTTATSAPASISPTTATTGARPASNITASNSVVGIGGTIEFNGTCDRSDFGSVVVQITGTTTELVDTGLTGSSWSFTWAAPTDPLLISSFEFEFWCGDPAGATDVTFPDALRRRVDMVASEAPSPPSPTPAADPTQVILPETS
jgi:hypothetical protein